MKPKKNMFHELASKLFWKNAIYDFLTFISGITIIGLCLNLLQLYSSNIMPLLIGLSNARTSGNQELVDNAVLNLGPEINKVLWIGLLIFTLGFVVFAVIFSLLQKSAWQKKASLIKFSLFNFIWMLALLLIFCIEIALIPKFIIGYVILFELICLPFLSSCLIENYDEKKLLNGFKLKKFSFHNYLLYLTSAIILSFIFLLIIAFAGSYAIIPTILYIILISGLSRIVVRR